MAFLLAFRSALRLPFGDGGAFTAARSAAGAELCLRAAPLNCGYATLESAEKRQKSATMRLATLALLVASAAAEDRSTKPRWQSRFATYSIASVARRDGRSDWNEVTQGNRIVLPARVRDVLESRGLSPMQFQILNPNKVEGRLILITRYGREHTWIEPTSPAP